MRVLHITAAYKPAVIYGGPTMSVALLCEELNSSDIKVEVFTTTANGPTELDVIPNKQRIVDGVPVTYFKRITKDHTHFSPALLSSLRKRINEFDVVHIHAWWNLVSVLSCLIAVTKNIPVVLSPRGMISAYTFTNRNTLLKKLIHHLGGSYLLKKCNIHATSFREGIIVNKLTSTKTITIIPNFVKFPQINSEVNKQGGAVLKLLFLSRIEEKKGLDILLNALDMLTVPYHLTIAGDGEGAYIDQLKAMANEKNVSQNISWVGFINDEKFTLLQQHDLLVLPSHDENFGNVVIESLSVGTAVLISENVGLADYVSSNNLGWICQTTTKSVSEAINQIGVNFSSELARIGNIAPAMVRNDFTGQKLVDQYIDLYKK